MGYQVIWNCSKILCSNMTIIGHRQARQIFIAPLQLNSAIQAIMMRHLIYLLWWSSALSYVSKFTGTPLAN